MRGLSPQGPPRSAGMLTPARWVGARCLAQSHRARVSPGPSKAFGGVGVRHYWGGSRRENSTTLAAVAEASYTLWGIRTLSRFPSGSSGIG